MSWGDDEFEWTCGVCGAVETLPMTCEVAGPPICEHCVDDPLAALIAERHYLDLSTSKGVARLVWLDREIHHERGRRVWSGL